MKKLSFIFLFVLFLQTPLLTGCSRQLSGGTAVVTLAASERGEPQFDYSGPGKLNYHYAFGSFSFQIGPLTGSPWISATGNLNFSDSNHVNIEIKSSADRAYDIEMLGVWTNRTLPIPEEKAKETLHVHAGEQKLNVERFVIWTYDFSKEKAKN